LNAIGNSVRSKLWGVAIALAVLSFPVHSQPRTFNDRMLDFGSAYDGFIVRFGSPSPGEGVKAVQARLDQVAQNLRAPRRFVWKATALPDGRGGAERVSGQVLQA
jgi:hypothetical protein